MRSSKIVCAGLTPAWQQVLRFQALHPGEVNRATHALWCASGKVINVARALVGLGARARTIAPVGGTTGTQLAADLAELGVDFSAVQCSTPTRVCTTLLDESTRTTTELVENARPLSSTELAAFECQFAELAGDAALVVLSGSLPAGTPTDYFARLMARTTADVILDARGPELLATLEQRPRLVKPNRQELGHTLGMTLETDEQLRDAAGELVRHGAQCVLVTQGSGPVLVRTGSETLQFPLPPAPPIVNPIGCGDYLAAGLAWGLSLGESLEHSICLGLACASQNLATLLPATLDANRARADASGLAFARVK